MSFTVINSVIYEIIRLADDASHQPLDKQRVLAEAILRKLDELDAQIDSMLSNLSPERLTDEKFKMIDKILREIGMIVGDAREHTVAYRFTKLKHLLAELQSKIRHLHRLLILIASRASETQLATAAAGLVDLDIKPPESILFKNPLAAKLYALLVREGEVLVEDLAEKLGIPEERRSDLGVAIMELVKSGNAELVVTPDNKFKLKLRSSV